MALRAIINCDISVTEVKKLKPKPYENSLKYTIPLGMDSFIKMFKELYES